MASWSLSASGAIPAMDPAADPAAPAQDTISVEVELYEALKAVLADPKFGTAASSYSASHVSGSLHEPDA